MPLFQSGLVHLRRASTVTTAGALSDGEMERFRAARFETLGLHPSESRHSSRPRNLMCTQPTGVTLRLGDNDGDRRGHEHRDHAHRRRVERLFRRTEFRVTID